MEGEGENRRNILTNQCRANYTGTRCDNCFCRWRDLILQKEESKRDRKVTKRSAKRFPDRYKRTDLKIVPKGERKDIQARYRDTARQPRNRKTKLDREGLKNSPVSSQTQSRISVNSIYEAIHFYRGRQRQLSRNTRTDAERGRRTA